MTLAELREAVLEGAKESISSRGLVGDRNALDRWINRANEGIWVDAVERCPPHWRLRAGPLTAKASDGFLAYSDIDKGGVYKVDELKVQGQDRNFRVILPLENSTDASLLEPQGASPPSPANELPTRWYVEGEAIWFSPVLTRDIVVNLVYRAQLPDMKLDGDLPLGVRLHNHHDLVVLKAIQLLAKKDEEGATPWDQEVKEGTQAMYRTLRRTQGHQTRRTRKASHY